MHLKATEISFSVILIYAIFEKRKCKKKKKKKAFNF